MAIPVSKPPPLSQFTCPTVIAVLPEFEQQTVGYSECLRMCRWHAHLIVLSTGTKTWLAWRRFYIWQTYSLVVLLGEDATGGPASLSVVSF